MIRYALACDAGHEFEGWFGSSADYDDQRARGLLSCPLCDSGQVLEIRSNAIPDGGVVVTFNDATESVRAAETLSRHLPRQSPRRFRRERQWKHRRSPHRKHRCC